MLNHMVVDHRPKALTVGGFVEEEKDELLQHFSVSVTCKLIHVSLTDTKSGHLSIAINLSFCPKIQGL